jgi:hypothetical protein
MEAAAQFCLLNANRVFWIVGLSLGRHRGQCRRGEEQPSRFAHENSFERVVKRSIAAIKMGVSDQAHIVKPLFNGHYFTFLAVSCVIIRSGL